MRILYHSFSSSPSHRTFNFVSKVRLFRRTLSVLPCVMLIAWTFVSAQQPAQRTGNTGLAPQTIATPDGLYNSQAGLEHLNLDINLRGRQQTNSEWRKSGRDSSCFFPPLDMVQDAAVGTAGLALPKNAKKEYGKACEVLADNKNDEAEKHLRKAIELFPNYVASWVLLGQILEKRPDLTGARMPANMRSQLMISMYKHISAWQTLRGAEVIGRGYTSTATMP